MAKVVGVKFKDAGKLYYFSPAKIDVKMGDKTATAWGCDLTHGYIEINADYRS